MQADRKTGASGTMSIVWSDRKLIVGLFARKWVLEIAQIRWTSELY